MFDIHCHIIYGVDDGSQTLDESVRMAEIAGMSGTRGIVATPHTNVPGAEKNYWSRELLDKVKAIREELRKRHINIKIFCGQEIFCTRDTVELLKSGELITLNNTKYPLVEFGFYEQARSVLSIVSKLVAEGYTPIIAHPERYEFIHEDFHLAQKLKRMGCLLQVNKGSILGNLGESTMETANRMLETHLADIVASDAHGPYMRTTSMDVMHELICENYSYDYANLVLNINPGLVLQNSETYIL